MAYMDMNGTDGAMGNCQTTGSSFIADGNQVDSVDAIGT